MVTYVKQEHCNLKHLKRNTLTHEQNYYYNHTMALLYMYVHKIPLPLHLSSPCKKHGTYSVSNIHGTISLHFSSPCTKAWNLLFTFLHHVQKTWTYSSPCIHEKHGTLHFSSPCKKSMELTLHFSSPCTKSMEPYSSLFFTMHEKHGTYSSWDETSQVTGHGAWCG